MDKGESYGPRPVGMESGKCRQDSKELLAAAHLAHRLWLSLVLGLGVSGCGDLGDEVFAGERSVDALGAHSTPLIEGSVASHGAWPMQVQLRLFDAHFCGAVLLHPRWVLTAGHCVAGFPEAWLSLRVGAFSANAVTDEVQAPDIERVLLHPDYAYGTNDNDLALIELRQAVELNEAVQPVALACRPPRPGSFAVAVGWGSTVTGYEAELAEELQQVDLPIVSRATCNDSGQFSIPLGQGTLCAGTKAPGASTCIGDSGGPLLRWQRGRWTVVGVSSRGAPACEGYSAFSDLSHYRLWIRRWVPRRHE